MIEQDRLDKREMTFPSGQIKYRRYLKWEDLIIVVKVVGNSWNEYQHRYNDKYCRLGRKSARIASSCSRVGFSKCNDRRWINFDKSKSGEKQQIFNETIFDE